MTLKDSSPCDCSIIPVSEKEADLVFNSYGDELRNGLYEADKRSSKCVVCPGCGDVTPIEKLA